MLNFRRTVFTLGVVLVLALAEAATQAEGLKPAEREALRRQAEQPSLTPEARRKAFEALRKLVLDESALPDDRCADFYRGMLLLQQVDPAGALAFAKSQEGAAWIGSATPKGQGLFACGVAIANLASRQNAHALEVLTAMSLAARSSDPEVEATRAHCLLLAAVALGRQPEASEAVGVLYRASADERLKPGSRAEYLLDLLRLMFDQGAPPSTMNRLIARGEALLPKAEGRPGDQLDIYLTIVKSTLDFEGSDPVDQRVTRLEATVAKLRGRFQELRPKYGEADLAVIMAAQGLSSINLELAPFRRDASELERESVRMCDFLIAHSTGAMVEPERVWFIRGVACAMLGDVPESRKSYQEVEKIHAAAGLGPDAGFRFSRRLTLLAMFGDNDPGFVAKGWTSGVEAFATHIRSLAVQDPDLALSSLQAWNPMSSFGSIARHGRAATFLDGYIQATGLVKNVPYRRKGLTPEERQRLYGRVGLPQVQAKLSPQRPMLVYVLFHDPLTPHRSYYGGFRMDGKSVKFVDLGPSETVDAEVAKWRKSMRDPLDGGEGDPAVTGRALYARLVRPLIGGKLPPNLLIVADQGLEQVSFAALRTPQSRWVLQDCAVGYLGAVRDVARAPAVSAPRASALVQGDVYRDHVRLGAASLSLKALKTIDASATIRTASSEELQALRSPRYLHLSVHGESRKTDQPLEVADASSLILPAAGNEAHDISFTARQVAGMRLDDTRCVLLAACSAAKGQVLSGEGIGGLRRAFYIAGARSVIASLFLVSETQSSLADRRANGAGQAPGDALLAKVYGALAHGDAPTALRRAQLQMLANKETASPRYWGGFICEGN